jgi:mannose-6-phosphate isomerase
VRTRGWATIPFFFLLSCGRCSFCLVIPPDVVEFIDDMSIERDERPWGAYEVLAEGEGYKVKRIEVYPGHRLSLQMHQSRSEHWVIVTGEAIVTLGETEIGLRANQEAHIPARTKHRVANPGKSPLIFIEVQCGGYLGEDDITRFEDDYNRTAKFDNP